MALVEATLYSVLEGLTLTDATDETGVLDSIANAYEAYLAQATGAPVLPASLSACTSAMKAAMACRSQVARPRPSLRA